MNNKLKIIIGLPILLFTTQAFAQDGYIAPNSGVVNNYNYNQDSSSNNSSNHKIKNNKQSQVDNLNVGDMSTKELELLLMAGNPNNFNPDAVKLQAEQLKSTGGTLKEPPTIGRFGRYKPGVISNSNGTQTLMLPSTAQNDSSRFGANVPPPPRAVNSGSPTGNTSGLNNTFLNNNGISIGQDINKDESIPIEKEKLHALEKKINE